MKKFIKRFLIVVALLMGTLLTYLYIPTPYSQNVQKMVGDTSAVFSMRKTASNADISQIDIQTIDIQYINQNGQIATRPIWLHLPKNATQPVPLVFVPHYETKADASDLQDYIKQGWAVASPKDFGQGNYNEVLVSDNLVFNNAALYALRNNPAIDKQKIVLSGGSAGGYMSLMLASQQMGITAVHATAPITNFYFNFYQYFPAVAKINAFWQPRANIKIMLATLTAQDDQKRIARIMHAVGETPMPYVGMSANVFGKNLSHFPDANDVKRWEAFSPVALTHTFNTPIVINHATSDVLVPIDQITRQFTYDTEGETMPKNISTRLNAHNFGVLGKSLVDMLPKEQTEIQLIKVSNPNADSELPFNANKMFNIVVYDDGKTQAWGNHTSTGGTGLVNDVAYLKAMIDKGLKNNEILTNGKLLLLLARYQGNSVQLPAHKNADKTVYGSWAMYQQEVVAHLQTWADNHSFDELEVAVKTAIASQPEKQAENEKAWNEIAQKLKLK